MSNILCLDIGSSRIGVAIASRIARLPRPYKTLANTDSILDDIKAIIDTESVDLVVVGLPRSLAGHDTDQTRYCREFAERLAKAVTVVLQDEALTSKKAESELHAKGKQFEKGDIDSLAATYILEDYLTQHGSNS